MDGRIGEVIEATTTEFIAESYVLHQAPSLGALVRVSDREYDIYALTGLISTTSIDPGRRPVARGQSESSPEALYAHNPELASLLRTEFHCLIVGHRPVGAPEIRHYLPPRPPQIHGFVYPCTPAEVRAFTSRLDFLPALLEAPPRFPVDELVAACLRQASRVHPDPLAFCLAAGRRLALLLTDQPARLTALLARLKPEGRER